MAPPPPRKQVRPARRVQQAKASRARITARGRAVKAAARLAQQRAQGRLGQRGFSARPQQQRAEAAGGGDESDSGDSRILDPAVDGGSEEDHPGSDDEMEVVLPPIWNSLGDC